MNRIARTLLLATALTTSAASCAAVVSYLPTVVAVVTDGLLVVDQIKNFVDGVHAVKPELDLTKVYAAISRTKVALDAALRATNGVDKLTKEQADAAFVDFRVFYQELVALVGPLGVTTGNGLKAGPGTLQVPTPLAINAVAMDFQKGGGAHPLAAGVGPLPNEGQAANVARPAAPGADDPGVSLADVGIADGAVIGNRGGKVMACWELGTTRERCWPL